MESMMAGFGESSTAIHRWTAEKKAHYFNGPFNYIVFC